MCRRCVFTRLYINHLRAKRDFVFFIILNSRTSSWFSFKLYLCLFYHSYLHVWGCNYHASITRWSTTGPCWEKKESITGSCDIFVALFRTLDQQNAVSYNKMFTSSTFVERYHDITFHTQCRYQTLQRLYILFSSRGGQDDRDMYLPIGQTVLGKFPVNKFAVGKLASGIFAWGNFAAVKFCASSIYLPPCTLPSTVNCSVHLHTGPAPSVYTAFPIRQNFLKQVFLQQTCLRRIFRTWAKQMSIVDGQETKMTGLDMFGSSL